ncbi:hypothetical protein QBC37DRAFT_379602 [Rhypophila decipiens]|uniref:Rhodopsin domain-containing protein n=1 Tax=Rhypophila decipiens TaxID=261697 RepID=A0AAN6XWD5_9PEZI|nr:hypothetical protein QBC37DRAFT_379602 [Rhypophila decipiens]
MASSSAVPVTLTSVLLALAVILVGARMYTRGLVTRSFGPEDPLMVVSLLGTLAHQVGFVFQIRQGLGDVSKVDAADTDSDLPKWLFAALLAYQGTRVFLCLSIAYQYRGTLVLPSTGTFNLFLAGWLGVSGLLGVGLVFLHCTPVQEFWMYDQKITRGCENYLIFSFLLAILNMANDLALWAFPLASVFRLRMPLNSGLSVYGVLALGFGVVVCSTLRLSAAAHIVSPSAIDLESSHAVLFAVAGSLELSLAIISACLVTIEPLWTVMIQQRRSTPTEARGLNSSLSGYRHQAQGSQSGQSILLDELTTQRITSRSVSGNDSNEPVSPSKQPSPITSLPRTDSPIPRPFTSHTMNYSRPVPGPSSSLHYDQGESAAGPSDSTFVDIPLDTPPERPATPAENVAPGIVVTRTLDIVYRSHAELGRVNDEALAFGTSTTCSSEGPASWQGQRGNYIHHFAFSRK